MYFTQIIHEQVAQIQELYEQTQNPSKNPQRKNKLSNLKGFVKEM